jgi:hypothetical protein
MDLDKDGDIEVAIAAEKNISIWDLPFVYKKENIDWPKWQHDNWNTGYFTPKKINDLEDLVSNSLPKKYELHSNYPNPFNSVTTISYALLNNETVLLEIYNVLGEKIRTLVDERQSAGVYRIQWKGLNDFGVPVSSSIYFYRIQTSEFVKTKKMIMMK